MKKPPERAVFLWGYKWGFVEESEEWRVESEDKECPGTTYPWPSAESTLLRGNYGLNKFILLCVTNSISTLNSSLSTLK
jgi:hypothetical protein